MRPNNRHLQKKYSGLMKILALLLLAAAPLALAQKPLDIDALKEQARVQAEKIDAQKPASEAAAPLAISPREEAWKRFEKDVQRAGEMAPPRAGQAPKVEEITEPGGYGRRRYRVITATGTYCITYESNHAPDGIDSMANGIKPKITNCP